MRGKTAEHKTTLGCLARLGKPPPPQTYVAARASDMGGCKSSQKRPQMDWVDSSPCGAQPERESKILGFQKKRVQIWDAMANEEAKEEVV